MRHLPPNAFHLVMDIAWFGVAFAATSRFLTIYAIRLGASPAELTLLTAMPALCLFATAWFSGWWRRRHPDSVRAIFWPALGMRLTFLLPVFTPWMPADYQIAWLILSVSLPALPQGVASVLFWGVLREAINDPDMRPLFGWRMAALNLTLGASVIVFGLFLERIVFPLNYQIIFGIAFLASLVSFWHVARVRVEPELLRATRPIPQTPPPNIWRDRAFGTVAGITLVTHLAFYAVFPLVPLWLAEALNASDRFLIEFGLAELYAGAALSMLAPRLMRRFDFRPLIGASMLLTGAAVGLVVAAPALWVALPAAVLIGAGWTLVSIGTQAMFMSTAPAHATTAYALLFSQILFFSTGVGPFIGNLFSDLGWPLAWVLLAGMGLRLAAAGLVWFWPVPRPVLSPAHKAS